MSLRKAFGYWGLFAISASAFPSASACSNSSNVDFAPLDSAGEAPVGVPGSDAGGSANERGGASAGNDAASGSGAGRRSQAGTGGGGASGAGAGGGGKGPGGGASGNPSGGAVSEGGTSGAGAGSSGSGNTAGGGGTSSCTATAEICDGLDNDCDEQVDPPGTCPESCVGAVFGDERYLFCGPVVNAAAASTVCADAAMAGVSIESEEENDFVLSRIAGPTWLAGSDTTAEGEWRWNATGQMFWNDGEVKGVYENWQGGEPNNFAFNEDCLIIAKANVNGMTTGKWNDQPCAALSYRVACESKLP